MTASSPVGPPRSRGPRLRGGLVGAGAAACAVCCAAPLLTLLGIGVTGAAATALTILSRAWSSDSWWPSSPSRRSCSADGRPGAARALPTRPAQSR